MKAGARVLGIDDSPFTKKSNDVLVVGVVWRDGVVEGVLSTRVRRDGMDSTEKLKRMVKDSKFHQQIRVIVTHGATLGGFNIIDLKELSRSLGVPVIAVTRRKPDMAKVEAALRNLSNWRRRAEVLRGAGKPLKCGRVYAQVAGMDEGEARRFLLLFNGIPEPVRLAHLIGSGVVRGESHGKV